MKEELFLPDSYISKLNLIDTERSIKLIKDKFEEKLSNNLNLERVSAPLFIRPETGLNDDLNGVERPVCFDIKDTCEEIHIIHSLAKWKRYTLKRYGFSKGSGIYTDMNAIRRDEVMDNLHSIYVDQWDWEKVITQSERNMDFLKDTVKKIINSLCDTQEYICSKYKSLKPFISRDVFYITSQELEDLYKDLTPKQREREICKKYKTVFVSNIGAKLKSGRPHDLRAPDYDDWKLNGDILVWYPILDRPVEISSMGIRVDSQTLHEQLKTANCLDREKLEFHSMLLNNELPLTIGGGIGQSRICLILLNKAHIGEVQASIWPKDMIDACSKNKIILL